ncbi:unnamed protein product [Auanema sp. JU1783]|nr:unnamed protein product [Auanema sp. JU1783]
MYLKFFSITILFAIFAELHCITLLQSYRSPAAAIRRQGQSNTRFRPVLFLRGDDDWRKQLGQETLTDQVMDENGIFYNVRPQPKDITNAFSSNPNRVG